MSRIRFSQFHSALVDAQRSREYMPMMHAGSPYWNTYEMLTMWRMVNMMRQSHERPFLPFEEIEKAESMASGHSDYTKKFALYCSELVDKES